MSSSEQPPRRLHPHQPHQQPSRQTRSAALQDLNAQLREAQTLQRLAARQRQLGVRDASPTDTSLKRSAAGLAVGTRIPRPLPSRRPRPYDPAYTWGRGGRVKELRIRCLARKFLHLWRQRAGFGRVSMATARRHWRRRLLWRCFRAWYGVYWTERKELRLNLRAQCHLRLRLWTVYFYAWRRFVTIQRAVKAQLSRADELHSRHLLRRAYEAWRSYALDRRSRAYLSVQAYSFHGGCLLRRYWSAWLDQLASVRAQAVAMETAAEHWSQRQKGAVLDAWRQFVELRRISRGELSEAAALYERRLARRCLTVWRSRLARLAERRQFLQRVDELARRCRLRRCLLAWRQQRAVADAWRDLRLLAERHWRRRLLRRCLLSGFRAYAMERQKKLELAQLADVWRQRSRLRSAWRAWLVRCEQNEEIALLPKSRLARAHSARRLVRLALRAWRQRCEEWRQTRQALLEAERHRAQTVAPRALSALAAYAAERKRKRELAATADAFYATNSGLAALRFWRDAAEAAQEARYQERVAALHWMRATMSRYLQVWRAKTEERVLANEREVLSEEHRRRRLLGAIFSAWQHYTQRKCRLAEADEAARRSHRRHRLFGALSIWRHFVELRRQKRRCLDEATAHRERQLTRRCWTAWRARCLSVSDARQRARDLARQKDQRLLANSFARLALAARVLGRRRRLVETALEQRRRRQLGAVFEAWHLEARRKAQKKAETREQVVAARSALRPTQLRRFFNVWSLRADELVLMRLKLCHAQLHSDRRQLSGAFSNWRRAVAERRQTRAAIQLADQHRRLALQRRAFLAWLEARQRARLAQRQSEAALWHWALRLQARCLLAWLQFMCTRVYERQRRLLAAQRYRRHLISDAVSRWMTTAACLSGLRATCAADCQLEAAQRRLESARRAGAHWRRWARERAARNALRRASTTAALPTASPPAASARPASQPTFTQQSASIRQSLLRQLQQQRRPPPKCPEFLRSEISDLMMTSSTAAGAAAATGLTFDVIRHEAASAVQQPLPIPTTAAVSSIGQTLNGNCNNALSGTLPFSTASAAAAEEEFDDSDSEGLLTPGDFDVVSPPPPPPPPKTVTILDSATLKSELLLIRDQLADLKAKRRRLDDICRRDVAIGNEDNEEEARAAAALKAERLRLESVLAALEPDAEALAARAREILGLLGL
ncbi:hypothetical protein BOX15_Mlig026275g2 [Macrostomum lignano]|uniref:Sfi1 spindle body domain-containing protein n=2 Tax=Macrostomum lignano TaxID=282301 RepID=A0A267EJU4_9PLAT|nr:hypothetical protein BOX15_Mlig026275g2 [Macrostomum lignano]